LFFAYFLVQRSMGADGLQCRFKAAEALEIPVTIIVIHNYNKYLFRFRFGNSSEDSFFRHRRPSAFKARYSLNVRFWMSLKAL